MKVLYNYMCSGRYLSSGTCSPPPKQTQCVTVITGAGTRRKNNIPQFGHTSDSPATFASARK